ncbi:MAG: winged helix-turn-helix transcriptional regulator [Brumimicrobium sp.]
MRENTSGQTSGQTGGQTGGQTDKTAALTEKEIMPQVTCKSELVDGLVESQQKIIELIAANPKISKREMSSKIGISSTAIDKNIKSLKDKKIIKRIGSDRSGYWELIDQTKN